MLNLDEVWTIVADDPRGNRRWYGLQSSAHQPRLRRLTSPPVVHWDWIQCGRTVQFTTEANARGTIAELTPHAMTLLTGAGSVHNVRVESVARVFLTSIILLVHSPGFLTD